FERGLRIVLRHRRSAQGPFVPGDDSIGGGADLRVSQRKVLLEERDRDEDVPWPRRARGQSHEVLRSLGAAADAVSQCAQLVAVEAGEPGRWEIGVVEAQD